MRCFLTSASAIEKRPIKGRCFRVLHTAHHLLFFILIFQSLTAFSKSEFAPTYSKIVPGLDYANIRLTNQPWSIHIARLDRSRKDFEIITTLGKGTIQGLAPLSEQVKAAKSPQLNPVAAVNGDFFLIAPGPYQGDPKGLQILNGELVSEPDEASLWTEANGQLHSASISKKFALTWPDGSKTSFGLNETPKTNGVVLFTPIFGASTRNTNGLEIVLESAGRPWLPLRADENYHARVREVRAAGDTPLVADTMVLSIGRALTDKFTKVKVGGIFQISTAMSTTVKSARFAIGGGPILVTHGNEQKWLTKSGDAHELPRHPRTAVGWSGKYFFLVEVDGRQKDLSMGMNYAELAHMMKEIGCTEAMNLDGGGSATFWLNGKVMNSPSDKHERSLANAVMIAHRETKTR